jgi:hypothetical protein
MLHGMLMRKFLSLWEVSWLNGVKKSGWPCGFPTIVYRKSREVIKRDLLAMFVVFQKSREVIKGDLLAMFVVFQQGTVLFF